ncbi:MAG: SMP-30/gluconolactonase/LRE family protein [Planctomycetota bacterium]
MLTEPLVRVAEGVPGAEGPIYDHDGRWFVVSSDGPVLQIDPRTGDRRQHARTDGTPAGLQVDADNHLWLIDAELGVLRIAPDGTTTPVCTHQDGAALSGCNDGALDSAGNLYFTVPAGSSVASPHGRVCCRMADGGLRTVAEGFAFCNGLAVSEDERTLVVAETWTKRLIAFDLPEPGVARNRRTFAALPGDHPCGPDGIDFDAEGRLISTNYGNGELDVFAPDGELIERIDLPFGAVSNLHLGGPDGRDLLVTEHDAPGVWRGRWSAPGIRLAGRSRLPLT